MSAIEMSAIDSVLLVSFGGPERPEDVIPFLRNVTAGRDVPEARLRLVADQYLQFGGKSPINDQNRALLTALEKELAANDIALPVYWGNRNWHPYLSDAIAKMAQDGRRHGVAVVTSAYSSYSSCRQYRENIDDALEALPADGNQLKIDKMGQFFDQPGFVDPFAGGLRSSFGEARSAFAAPEVAVVFTAHSLPNTLAASCRYEDQLRRTAQRVAEEAGIDSRWDLVFQSRSGALHTPWLEPDINDHLRALHEAGVKSVVVVPVGFLSDHQEVIFDLDFTAAATASGLGMQFARVATPGTDPRFVVMLREQIQVHLAGGTTSKCLGMSCCPAPQKMHV